jgi:hypothetical protein
MYTPNAGAYPNQPPTLPTLPTYTPRDPWGITPNVSKYQSPDYATIAKFGQRTPQELQAMNSVSALARLISGQGSGLYNVGSPAYAEALNYYKQLLSGNKQAVTAAIAPNAQAVNEIYKGAANSAAAGPLRGGAREQQSAELERQRAGQIAGLPQQAIQNAAAQAGSLGLSGAQAGSQQEQAGAGLYGQLASAEQQNRQQAISQSQNQQQIGLNATLGAANLTLQDLVQSGRLGLDEYQAMVGNNLALGKLTLDQYLGQGNLNIQQQQLALKLKELDQQNSAAKGGLFGKLFGALLPFLTGGKGGGGTSPSGDTYDLNGGYSPSTTTGYGDTLPPSYNNSDYADFTNIYGS